MNERLQDSPLAAQVQPLSLGTLVMRIGLGIATLMVALAVWVLPGDQFLWNPLTSSIIAALLILLHLAVVGRRLDSFDPATWLPVMLFLYYFGMPIAVELIAEPGHFTYHALGANPPPSLARGSGLALLSLISFILGFHLLPIASASAPPCPARNNTDSFLGAALCILLGGSLMTAIGLLIAGPTLLFGEYGRMKEAGISGAADFRFLIIGSSFMMAGAFATISAHTSRRWLSTLLAFATSGFLALLLIGMGDRGGLSCFVIALGWVITRRIRKISRTLVAVGFVVAFQLMPMVKEYRDFRTIEESRNVSLRNLASSSFYEMGQTSLAFSYTVEYIPARKSYDYGGSVVQALLDAVPNVGFTVGKGFLLSAVKHEPSHWFAATADPIKYYYHGPGFAYALGAEWYFNFGVPGVIFGMAFMGSIVSVIRKHSASSEWALFIGALYIQFIALHVRNSLGFPLKVNLWPLIGLSLIYVAWPFGRRTLAPSSSGEGRSAATRS